MIVVLFALAAADVEASCPAGLQLKLAHTIKPNIHFIHLHDTSSLPRPSTPEFSPIGLPGEAPFTACRKSRIATDSYRGMTSELAEKLALGQDLKGHGFSRAVQVSYFCHSSRTLVRGESASSPSSAASSVMPQGMANRLWGFSPCTAFSDGNHFFCSLLRGAFLTRFQLRIPVVLNSLMVAPP
jgi:hypothetical protein